MCEELQKLGLAPLFADVYKRCFHLDWSGPSGALVVTNMYYVALAMWNSTDKSVAICEQVIKLGLVGDLFKYLKSPKVQLDNLTESGFKYCVSPMISILHNVVQVCSCFVICRSIH